MLLLMDTGAFVNKEAPCDRDKLKVGHWSSKAGEESVLRVMQTPCGSSEPRELMRNEK